ncbi:MAG: c-type cytochrome [Myxococcota bacterium]
MAKNLGLMRVFLPLALVASAHAGTTAPAPSPEPEEHGGPEADDASAGSPADRLLARLGYVRADYAHAVVDGKAVDAHEYEEQEEMIEDALATATGLPLSPATRAALGEIEAAVARKAPAKQVEAGIDGVVARVRDELWLELATPEPARLSDGAALFAANCASCHGADGEGPSAELAASLKPAPVPLAAAAVAAPLSPRRVYEAVTFGIPETAMASRAGDLSEAERAAVAFGAAGLATGDAPATPPKKAPRYTLEELADLSNAALAAAAPKGPSGVAVVADLRGRATRAAAGSPMRGLRTLARAAVGPGGDAALAPLRDGWRTQRPLVAAADKGVTAKVDTSLAALGAATTPEARRQAAEQLIEALSAAERVAQ